MKVRILILLMIKITDNTNILQGPCIPEVCVLHLLFFYYKHIEDPLPDDHDHDHDHQSTVFNGFDQSLSTKDSRLAVKSSRNFLLFFCSSGRLVTGLVREFLEYFDLDFSIAVFDPETNFVSISLLNKMMSFMLDTSKFKSVLKYHTGWPLTLDHTV